MDVDIDFWLSDSIQMQEPLDLEFSPIAEPECSKELVKVQVEERGLIIIADDQSMNLEALKLNLTEINQISNAEFYINGQQVIDRVKDVLGLPNLLQRPIHSLLLDFQMPFKNGIQVVKEIKKIYEEVNKDEG